MFSLKGGSDLVSLSKTFDALSEALSDESFSEASFSGVQAATERLDSAIISEFDASVTDDSATVYEQQRGMTRASISHASSKGQTFPGAFGHAGYYKLDSVATAHGRTGSGSPGQVRADAIPAPLIGYWLEFGTDSHSLKKGARASRRMTEKSSARPSKGQGGSDTPHPGTPALNILTKAFRKTVNGMYDDMTTAVSDRVAEAF